MPTVYYLFLVSSEWELSHKSPLRIDDFPSSFVTDDKQYGFYVVSRILSREIDSKKECDILEFPKYHIFEVFSSHSLAHDRSVCLLTPIIDYSDDYCTQFMSIDDFVSKGSYIMQDSRICYNFVTQTINRMNPQPYRKSPWCSGHVANYCVNTIFSEGGGFLLEDPYCGQDSESIGYLCIPLKYHNNVIVHFAYTMLKTGKLSEMTLRIIVHYLVGDRSSRKIQSFKS